MPGGFCARRERRNMICASCQREIASTHFATTAARPASRTAAGAIQVEKRLMRSAPM